MGPVLAALVVTVSVALPSGAFHRTTEFLDFGAGVLALVCLTSTVLWGLAATDRLVLRSGHRLLAQGVHRGLAVAGIGFLALHIWVKVSLGRTSASAAAVAFSDDHQPVLVGLGTVAGYGLVAVAVSGAVRAQFAARGVTRWWRALHMCAYPAWGAAVVHGLKAGREASALVNVAYALCLLGVALALATRLLPRAERPRAATSRWRPWQK